MNVTPILETGWSKGLIERITSSPTCFDSGVSMSKGTEEPDLSPYMRLIEASQHFDDESRRGQVLISSGLIEEMLKDLIASLMIEGTPQKKLFDGEQAPIGSLGARIWIAQSLGLITSEEARDLDIIRKIRNKFAHQPDASFERADIRDTCMELTLYRHNEDRDHTSDPAGRFMGSAVVLMAALPIRAIAAGEKRLQARANDKHWFAV